MNLDYLIRESYKTAVDKGWWDKERSAGDIFANIHAEVSEAWECYRIGDTWDSIYFNEDKPEGIAAELADVLIRIFDLCAAKNIPLEEAIRLKMAYNITRPYRHGNKLA